MKEVIRLADLPKDKVPEKLRAEYYFDFAAHPFEHVSLIQESKSVVEVIGKIGGYAERWLRERPFLRRFAGR